MRADSAASSARAPRARPHRDERPHLAMREREFPRRALLPHEREALPGARRDAVSSPDPPRGARACLQRAQVLGRGRDDDERPSGREDARWNFRTFRGGNYIQEELRRPVGEAAAAPRVAEGGRGGAGAARGAPERRFETSSREPRGSGETPSSTAGRWCRPPPSPRRRARALAPRSRALWSATVSS